MIDTCGRRYRFIIEELDDAQFTVFAPSVPTPFVGTVYILGAERVHPLDVAFPQPLKAVTCWRSGSRDLVAAVMRERKAPLVRTK